jgi:hypothetical protein
VKHLQRQKHFEEEKSFDRKTKLYQTVNQSAHPILKKANWASRSGSQKDDQLRQKSRHHAKHVSAPDSLVVNSPV